MTLSVEERAKVLVEALPYIKRFYGQTVVIKVGGNAIASARDETLLDEVLLRYVGIIISIIPLFLGLIWAAFDSRKQGWHDKIAGTYVVKVPRNLPL